MKSFMQLIGGFACLYQIFAFVVLIMGLVHAFSNSILLGFLAILVSPATIVIEIVDWFAAKDLWKELSDLLNSLIN